MIKNDIDDNAGESFAGGMKKFFCFKKYGVCIGKSINGPMKHNSVHHVLGELIQKAFGGSPGEVTQNCSDA